MPWFTRPSTVLIEKFKSTQIVTDVATCITLIKNQRTKLLSVLTVKITKLCPSLPGHQDSTVLTNKKNYYSVKAVTDTVVTNQT